MYFDFLDIIIMHQKTSDGFGTTFLTGKQLVQPVNAIIIK